MKIFLTTLSLVILNSCQPLRVYKGALADKETCKPIIGAKVYNKAKVYETSLSDSLGNFSLITPRSFFAIKPVRVIVEKESYNSVEIKYRKSIPAQIFLEYKYALRYDESECKAVQDSIDGQKVYISVDKMPEFPGGEAEMNKYISDHFFPPALLDNELPAGKLYVSFIIDAQGKTRNICIGSNAVKGTLTEAELALMEVIKGMPDWKPGRLAEVKVPVKFNIPIYLEYR